MAKVWVDDKEMDIILEVKVVEKAKELSVSEDLIREVLQNNPEALHEPENEEVMITGNPTITFIKTPKAIIVTNLIGQQNIF